MKKDTIKKLIKRVYMFCYNFAFICYFSMFLFALGMFGWFILYLTSGIAGTALYYMVCVVLVCFSMVLIWLGVIEVFKKYIKK